VLSAVQIGQLRRTLGAVAIVTSDVGYALAAQPDQVDVVRFEQLVRKGRRLAWGRQLG
jgi:two-component SAPR family response regulator